MDFLMLLLCTLVGWVLSRLVRVKQNTIIGKTIGFEKQEYFGHSYISPILNYEVNGVKYRCVYMLLYCEDTPANRQLYMNKEYTLYYDEKRPNIVNMTGDKKLRRMIVFILLTSFIFITLKILLIFMGR